MNETIDLVIGRACVLAVLACWCWLVWQWATGHRPFAAVATVPVVVALGVTLGIALSAAITAAAAPAIRTRVSRT